MSSQHSPGIRAADTVPTVKDLQVIVDQVWLSYIDPEGLNPFRPAESVPGRSGMHAAVSVSGRWDGQVVVACSPTQARNLAAAFLAMHPDEVATEDLDDVLGELANIVGGNVKSMLPPECFLSPPQVVSQCEDPDHGPNAERVCELVGTWMDEPLSIAMWHRGAECVEVAA